MSPLAKCAFVAALLLATPALAEPRVWTDGNGAHTTKATLVDFQNGTAYLKKEDGRILPIPVARLSDADQKFIKTYFPDVNVINGKVTGIVDGNTLTVTEGTTQHKVRLEGIAAPASHQDYAAQAKKALTEKTFQKDVRVEWREHDTSHRDRGQVFVDNRWINKELVDEGWAWHSREYPRDVLADAETKARSAKRGLWQGDNPTPPWEFHYSAPVVRNTRKLSSAADAEPEQQETIVYVTENGKKYHREGCRYLKTSSISMPLSEAAKKYTPCLVCKPPRPEDEQIASDGSGSGGKNPKDSGNGSQHPKRKSSK